MSAGADRHDAGAVGRFERGVQSEGEGEMAEIVCGELHLAALGGPCQLGQGHDAGVVDQHMHRPGPEPGSEVPDRRRVGDVEGRGLHSRIPGGFSDLGCDPAAGVEPSHTENDVGACGGQRTCGLHADAGSRSGDDGATAGQVDIGKDIGGRGGEPERGCKQWHCGPRALLSSSRFAARRRLPRSRPPRGRERRS